MKSATGYVVALILSTVVLAGCGAATKATTMIDEASRSERTDIFTQVAGTGTIPAGYADVIIRAHIKTHLEGYYFFEAKDLHGKAGYPFVMNIDGQAVVWKVDGIKDSKPAYKDGAKSRDPEGGVGMKYVLEKTVRIEAGSHRVFFGLPEESYYVTTDITVGSGRTYALEFRPNYGSKPKPHRATFLRGIRNYDVHFAED